MNIRGTIKHRHLLLASCAAIAAPSFVVNQEALAQQQAQAGALEEIVVSARRREEQLQDVPISIQALDNAQMEMRGIEQGSDLNVMIPNLSMGNSFVDTASLLTLRGIPNVGLYVDGIWQESAGFFQGNIVGIERVEVLRGPQGTLFGRNTNGGAIQYITTEPAPEFGSEVQLTVASDGRKDVSGSIDIPVSDNLFTKIVAASLNSDGWMKSNSVPDRAYGGRDDTYFRGDVLWRPSSDFEARFTANFSDVSRPTPRQVRWSTQGLTPGGNETIMGEHFRQTVYNVAALNPDYGPYDFWEGEFPQGTNRFPIFLEPELHDPEWPGATIGKFETRADIPLDLNTNDIDQYTMTLTWDISSSLRLTSLSAYRTHRTDGLTDFFATELGFVITDNRINKNTLYSEELHLEGSLFEGAVDFLLGGYYQHERQQNRHYRWGMEEFFIPNENRQPVPDEELISFVNAWGQAKGDPILADWSPVNFYDGGLIERNIPGRTQVTDNVTKEYALFGEATWGITERLDLTAGVRLAWNDGTERTREAIGAFREFRSPGISGHRGYGPGPIWGDGPIVREEDDFLTTDAVITPVFSAAYRWNNNIMTYLRYAEGFTRGEVNFDEELQREIVLDPEEVTNYELGLRSDWLGGSLRFNLNAYWMVWRGIRVTKQFPTPEGDLILTTVSGGKGRARGFESEIVIQPTSAWQIDGGVAMNDTEYVRVTEESPLTADTPWGFAPKWNFNVGTQYTVALGGDAGTVTVRGDVGYTSSFQMDPAVQRQAPEPEDGYALVNARVEYTAPSENWTLAFFGRNLMNKRYITGGIDAGQLWGIQFLNIGQKRELGARLSVNF